jgi:peroxisomal membrane protein 4
MGNTISSFLAQEGAANFHGALCAFKGLCNGAFYGTKIRLPHALVMTLLFKYGPVKDMLKQIMVLTFMHARNLAAFVGIYKSCLTLGRMLHLQLGYRLATPPGTPATELHSFIAGGVGGYLVWANYNGINFQIVLYLLSRITIALVKLVAEKKVQPFASYNFKQVYPCLAVATWATVLWLFEHHPKLLHSSLKQSMDFLYHDSNSWKGISDFLPSPATATVLLYMLVLKRERLGDLLDLSARL